jgi:hypothetical protein
MHRHTARRRRKLLFFSALGLAGLAAVVVVLATAAGGGVLTSSRQAAAVDCDCAHIEAGLLNLGWIPECRRREARVREHAARGALNIKLGPDGKIRSGQLCDPVAHGPLAWPVEGGPARPPARRADGRKCSFFVGLIGACGD